MKEELNGLKNDLAGKSDEQIKAALDSFQDTFQKEVEAKIEAKASAEALAAFEAKYEEGLSELKDNLNKMSAKFNEPKSQVKGGMDFMRDMIRKNFDSIKEVRKGHSVKLEEKAVADMTLGNNLTGDQPRSYSDIVAAVPGQALNLSDLVSTITIDGGTYTFPRETGSEGAIATQTEGSAKSQIDYDITMVDVNTDFIAGFAVYSKKMRNNLPFLESFLPQALRRDYLIQENETFEGVLAAAATASTEIITGQNKVEMLIADLAGLEGINYMPNGIVVGPADWYDILITEKSTGAGYGLPGVVTFEGGVLRVNGIPVFKANWIDANEYYVGDWSQVQKVVTEGLSIEFSESDASNFRENKITARVESQCGLAVLRPDALRLGDFTAV